ncbi:metallophosphoesterase family protein [Sinorhizobium meliloti]|uniref:metallophosphoesterase family protein n=1 Tax=Rhizobium meliloti TaxID=382 RepID=UPI003F5CE1DB
MVKPFRIVQLTDLHLSDKDSDHRIEPKIRGHLTGMNERFRALLRNPLLQQADLILVTGDVTDTGNMAGWEHFWNGISAHDLKEKTHVLVGNHDVAYLKLWRPVMPRVTRSISRARYMKGLSVGKSPQAYPWHALANNGNVLICALRSTMEWNSSSFFNALGRIPDSQLIKLRRILRDHSEVKHKIVALHHPPVFPADGSVEKFLHDVPKEEGNRLLEICSDNGVSLVLHGHMHAYMDQTFRTVRIIGAPASTQPTGFDEHVDLCVYDFDHTGHVLSRHQIDAENDDNAAQKSVLPDRERPNQDMEDK